MPKYSVSIEEVESQVNTYEFTVNADSEEDAIRIANELYDNGVVIDKKGNEIELKYCFTKSSDSYVEDNILVYTNEINE